MDLGGLGVFRRPGGDILWLGVKRNEKLNQLYFQMTGILAEKGFQLETREYRPHLTMGREVVFPAGFSGENFNRNFSGIRSEVTAVSLMKSERIAGRLTYSELYRKALA